MVTMMEVQRLFEEVMMPLWIGFGIVALAVPLVLLFHRRYELEDGIKKARDSTARWKERVRPWLFRHPRMVWVLGVVWFLYALSAIALLARAVLFHHWLQMVLWGYLTGSAVAPLLRRRFPPAQAEPEQRESPESLLPLTAADREAVQEIYEQRRKQRSWSILRFKNLSL